MYIFTYTNKYIYIYHMLSDKIRKSNVSYHHQKGRPKITSMGFSGVNDVGLGGPVDSLREIYATRKLGKQKNRFAQNGWNMLENVSPSSHMASFWESMLNFERE